MFKKKIKCRCGKKVDSNFVYCPFCGSALREIKEYEDEHEKELKVIEKNFDEAFKMPFFVKFPFKKLIREIDKQFRDFDRQIGETRKEELTKLPIPSQGISIKVETSLDGKPVIKVRQFGPGQKIRLGQPVQEPEREKREKEKQTKLQKLSTKKLTKAQREKLAKLPREEPQTSVRRLTDKIIYEISLPGIKNENDIIINKLENSIEIKAFTKDKAYFKLIPLNLPIKNYYLEKDKLILELKP